MMGGTYEAGNGGALGSRDPEVRRSRVEDDLEELRRRSELNLGKVLSVHVVCKSANQVRTESVKSFLWIDGWMVGLEEGVD